MAKRGVKLGTIRGPYKRRERESKYVCSLSFGKDSIATLLLALEHGEPLDAVIYVECMFDHERGISLEEPRHIRWIYDVAIPRLKELGVDVIVLRDESDYVKEFHRKVSSGKRYGLLRAFPMGSRCHIQRNLKLRPINKFYRDGFLKDGFNIVSYVGIAIDEVERVASLGKSESARVKKESLLVKYGYTETMALLKCHEYGLLSPIYFSGSGRNGCWCCPNKHVSQFVSLRNNNPELWGELKLLDEIPNKCSDRFRYDQSLSDLERNMDDWMDRYGDLAL
jgi:3'-phosphoadenosine 5'-phosphosulfate sulfotransferase (PAPS reductase)/FAD synthetase